MPTDRSRRESPHAARSARVADPYRDLSDPELWARSLSRSRRRREAAESSTGLDLHARPAAVATVAVLAGGPVAGIAAGKALSSGDSAAAAGGGERPTVQRVADRSLDSARQASASAGSDTLLADGPAAAGELALPVPAAALGTGLPLSDGERTQLAPPPPKPKPRPRRTLVKAERSSERTRPAVQRSSRPKARKARLGGGIRDLQRALGLSPDGVFGPATAKALKRWQAAHGLEADGVLGPATRRRLGMAPGPVLKRKPRRARRRGGGGGGSGGGQVGSGVVARVIAAANRIAGKPYKYGGGHGSFEDSGYDCSGSVSYALHGGGLLGAPLNSSGFMSYGEPGPGKHISIYANHGHVYMTINGRRFDTSARRDSGSRWSSEGRSSGGYVVRHPPGL